MTDYEDYDNSDVKSDNHNEIRISTTPKFQTNPQILLVNEGDTVRLPCYVDNLGQFVLIWKKDSEIISVAEQIIEKRFSLETKNDGQTLVLGRAELGDEGVYTCRHMQTRVSSFCHYTF